MSLSVPKNSIAPLVHPKLSATRDDLSLKHLSDETIITHIYSKHRQNDTVNIDVGLYLAFVQSIILTTSQIIETITQGTEQPSIFLGGYLLVNVVDLPLCTLHHVSSQLSCKAPGIEKAHETTLEILDILVSYQWEAKAVLTLTAFATEYGDIWHLNHYSLLDPLAKSLAMIKRVPLLKKQLDSIKYGQLLLSRNSLIYSCLLAIAYISKLKYNSAESDIKGLSKLSSVLRQIPLYSYWIIHIIVATRIEISSYLNETEGQSQKYLNELAEKINSILTILEDLLIVTEYKTCAGEYIDDLYIWLVDHIDNLPTEITLVLPKLIKGWATAKPFIDGSTRLEVSVEDALEGKNVILIISRLDISEDDIRALHSIFNEVKKGDKYKMVWIPVITVESQEEEKVARKKYEYLSSLMKWYIVPYTTEIAGLSYLQENWQLRQDPLVIVMDSKSKVQVTNVIHFVRVWGTEAFPWTQRSIEELLTKNWPEFTLFKFTEQPRLNSWVKQERDIIFYGGKDPNWIQQFENKVVEIKNDPYIKKKGNTFEIIRVGQNIKGENNYFTLTPHFWITQWSYFVIKSQLQGSNATETTDDILRLISYENENGWAILAVGLTPLLVGRGNLILGVLQDFNEWKRDIDKKTFSEAFIDYFTELNLKFHTCERMTLPKFSGWIPMIINCPECPRFMEAGISFKCNHGHPELS